MGVEQINNDSIKESIQDQPTNSPVISEGRKWVQISEKTTQRLVVAAKVLTVAIVIAALILAAILMGPLGPAAPAAGALIATKSVFVKKIFIACSIGLWISAAATGALAHKHKMHHYIVPTKQNSSPNLKITVKFLVVAAAVTAAITACATVVFTAIGALSATKTTKLAVAGV
jgi:hypothetical protein